eukprot:GHUV01021407.1.p1 GENE.GHUV01021407.1~~GHUV01021407.1.p1  ORF type:complete len:188 (+),score=21.12 GHUV01021407.1:308-871(+)
MHTAEALAGSCSDVQQCLLSRVRDRVTWSAGQAVAGFVNVCHEMSPSELSVCFVYCLQAEAEDAEFPDEIDTPQDMPARQQFAKYRSVGSSDGCIGLHRSAALKIHQGHNALWPWLCCASHLVYLGSTLLACALICIRACWVADSWSLVMLMFVMAGSTECRRVISLLCLCCPQGSQKLPQQSLGCT